MIEIICNEGEKKDKTQDEKIKRPKNIKQVGEIDSDRKIYIEDYAFTFINSLAYANPENQVVGLLLGDFQKNAGESFIFIKGAIKVKMQDDEGNARLHFDKKVWTSIYEESERYFHNLHIVGWYVSVPDITRDLMTQLTKLHIDNFAGNNKTLYIINTSEKDENFYLYENNELRRQKGYVCFYERNCEMQEYMLDNRSRKSVDSETNDLVTKNFRTIMQEKKEQAEEKKNTTMLYGVSTFMIVVVLVIGINIMNSYEKMRKFDESLDSIVKEISNMNVQTVSMESDEIPVSKIPGNVFPTEAETTTTVNETEAVTEPTVETSSEILKEPESATSEAATTASIQYKTYTVKKGDTLMSICKEYFGDANKYKEVMVLNNMENADRLYINQVIKLP